MNRNVFLSRPTSLAWLCLILHLCWITGLGVHTLCLESDGEHHAEWSASSCDADCDDPATTSEGGADGLSIDAPPSCVDCTDLTVDQPGLRHPRLSPTSFSALPVSSATSAWTALRKLLPPAASALPPSGLVNSGALPLRC